MAAKRFQTRTEKEIEQLLYDKSSKPTNKATDNAVGFASGKIGGLGKNKTHCFPWGQSFST